MKSRLSIRYCDSGMTVLELLVASTLGLMLFAMVVGSTMALRRLYETDLANTRVNQNLRSAMMLLSTDIRQAGERLPMGFPAVEIIDGGTGQPDELVLRRNILDEVLTICQTLDAGDTSSNIFLSSTVSGAVPSCVYGGQAQAYTVWQTQRAAEGGTHKVYLYNFSSRLGEFIEHTGETDSGTTMSIQRSGDPLANRYDAQASAVYALVEWRYRLDPATATNDILQVIENTDTSAPMNVTFGVTDFQIQAVMQDGTVLDNFGAADNWSLLLGIQIALDGQETVRGRIIESRVDSRFFPRNILSL